MANNYAPMAAESALECSKEDYDELISKLDPKEGSCGLEIEYEGDSLYLFSYEGYFHDDIPEAFWEKLGEIIKKNKMKYLQFGEAFYCDKMRSGEFGGHYFRLYTDGRIEGCAQIFMDDTFKTINRKKFTYAQAFKVAEEIFRTSPEIWREILE